MARAGSDARGPWIEAEALPREVVRGAFLPPPDLVQPWFPRSTIVSGSLGAGKTMLLRYLEQEPRTTSVMINLLEELAPAGDNAVPLDSSASVYTTAVLNKAAARLGCAIAAKLIKVRPDFPLPVDDLLPCLPKGLRKPWPVAEVRLLRQSVAEAPLSEFVGNADADRWLKDFVRAIAEATPSSEPLLLLMDRAEFVRPELLWPALNLLDKSEGYKAILATRPGSLSVDHLERANRYGVVDDFESVHLGTSPRSGAWLEHLRKIVGAQLVSDEGIDADQLDLILTVGRDSIRHVLRLATTVVQTRDPRETARVIDLLRRSHAKAVTSNMRGHHPNFGAALAQWRRDFLAQGPGITGPCNISLFESSTGSGRRASVSQFDRLLEHALRHAGLVAPEHDGWHPFGSSTELELPPLLMWRPGEPWWQPGAPKPMTIAVGQARFMSTGRGRIAGPSVVFLAYEFSRPRSAQFRLELAETFSASTDEGELVLTTGEAPAAGTRWGKEVGDRIRKSRCLLADVSGFGREVMFEAGFAYGLGRPFGLVVDDSRQARRAPEWMRTLQIASYETPEGYAGVIRSIRKLVDAKNPPWPRFASPAAASSALWIGSRPAGTEYDQFEAACAANHMDIDACHDEPRTLGEVEEYFRALAAAGLIVAWFDATSKDVLLNLCIGYACAKPKTAGQLSRRILAGGLVDQCAQSAIQHTALALLTPDKPLRRLVNDYCKKLGTERT